MNPLSKRVYSPRKRPLPAHARAFVGPNVVAVGSNERDPNLTPGGCAIETHWWARSGMLSVYMDGRLARHM
jgi:hypothetical protein